MDTQEVKEPNPELVKLFEERGKEPDKHPSLGMFEIINYKPYDGDTKHMWDRNNAEEVEAAKTMFENFKKKGFAVFAVDKKGEKGEQVREFDANAEKYIFVPPMRGG